MPEIQPLTELDPAQLHKIAGGYISGHKYALAWAQSDEGISFNLRLVTLDNWRDPVSLWSATMLRNSGSPQVCRSLGNAYIFNYPGRDPRRLQPREAIAVYRHCLVSFGRPELYLKNLGIAHAIGQRLQIAIHA